MEQRQPSLVELKAGVFDRLRVIERLQSEIQIINKEITKMEESTPVAPVEEAVVTPEVTVEEQETAPSEESITA